MTAAQMYPQTFLKTFWRMELKPTVFVAMSFARQYQQRFEEIIAPAIRSLKVDGVSLEPERVDISKSGDSILTEICEGIAHAQLVLADVSSIGKDSTTDVRYRNGNVMYEVGVALACRHHSEVLLIRDDSDQFLFDVSTIPHSRIDFTNEGIARDTLVSQLKNRLAEQDFSLDARVEKVFASLSLEEVLLLHELPNTSHGQFEVHWKNDPNSKMPSCCTISYQRLIDKNILRLFGRNTTVDFSAVYAFTPLGRIVKNRVETGVSWIPNSNADKFKN